MALIFFLINLCECEHLQAGASFLINLNKQQTVLLIDWIDR